MIVPTPGTHVARKATGGQKMDTAMRAKLRGLLMVHEGYKLKPYTDTAGKITIGIGRNLSDRGMLPTEVDQFFNNDADYFFNQLTTTYDWFPILDEPRQIALIDMAFMGMHRLAGFTDMLEAFRLKNYNTAAYEILNSEYAHEVGQRAKDIAQIIRTGNLL
jgi:lysozyme